MASCPFLIQQQIKHEAKGRRKNASSITCYNLKSKPFAMKKSTAKLKSF
jgi:hypothetical protein